MDQNGTIYTVSKADIVKPESLFCPFCMQPVFSRHFLDRIDHFAHYKENSFCGYKLENDMSEWHIQWQERFPEDCREVILKRNGKVHIADVLIGNLVIEFQHSKISIDNFRDRNDFYNSLGYSVIWIFDIMDDYYSDNITCFEGERYNWNNPPKLFREMSLKNENAVIYFQFDSDERVCLSRISSSYQQFKLFYTDSKCAFSIGDFVKYTMTNAKLLFPYYIDPAKIKKAYNEGGSTIEQLWDSKYKWIIVENINNRYQKFIIMGRKANGEIIKDNQGIIKGKIRFSENFVPIYEAIKPIWKIVNSKLKSES